MRWKTERSLRDGEMLISGRSKNLEELTHVCNFLMQYSCTRENYFESSTIFLFIVHVLTCKCYFILSLNFVCSGISSQLSLKG